jgi:hypothetical protein
LSKPWKIFSGIVGGILVVLGFLPLLSRISLAPGDPILPGDPFSARFHLVNEGSFTLRSISVKARMSGTLSHLDLKSI